MARVLIIAGENKEIKELARGLSRAGFVFSVADRKIVESGIIENPPDLILWQSGGDDQESLNDLLKNAPGERKPPVIALIDREKLTGASLPEAFNDFIVSPFNAPELVFRIKRLLGAGGPDGTNEFIKAGDLEIDTAKAEVLVRGGRVELTYREYELLCFLAGSPGRVYSREALLNKVWGYDYYGGDRTVDVHIRRLRSKIEIGNLSFIETVRNIGYRFRDDLETKIV
jgi:DNA-binding response OmpR family regulator